MARPKNFSRNEVLDRVIPVFWRHGLTGTNVQQLELATGVNRSGLYAEFDSKEQLFVRALDHYLETATAQRYLDRDPPGWDNIKHFLLEAPFNNPGFKGCFLINTTRDVAGLPDEAVDLVRNFNTARLARIQRNVAAEVNPGDVDAASETVWSFLVGSCIEANLGLDRKEHEEKVAKLLDMLRKIPRPDRAVV